MPDPSTIRRLYGRRQGHPLRAEQAALYAEGLPAVAVPDGALDAAALFGGPRPLQLEVGFGKGEHLAAQAAANPAAGYIGCEPFLNGVAGLLVEIAARGLVNLRIHRGDALDVLERLPDASLDRVYLLHPDPWPKARHAKRRFVNDGPLDLVAAKLKPDGEFRIGTDDPTYCHWTLMIMGARADFQWQAERPADWLHAADDWTETRYAAKARRAGRELWRFRYRRV